jgi:MarR family 2-MHQ and catechol resistance regulon transcriptional repressor
MSPATDGSGSDLLEHPHLTTIGLLVEATAGVHAALDRHLLGDGLSVQWFDVLLRLARTPGGRLRMSDLAAQTTLSASGLTRAVDRLEAAGLVRREPCPSDRRGAFAVLTAEGAARILGALPRHLRELEQVFAAFDAGVLASFTDQLRTLRDAINPAAAEASRADRA